MVAILKTIEAGPPPLLNDLAQTPLSDEEKAELRWGDEALTIGRDVNVSADEGPWARP